MRETVFVAANLREVDFAENLMDAEGIEYEVRPETVVGENDGVCLMGVVFEVEAEVAERCRKLLAQRPLCSL